MSVSGIGNEIIREHAAAGIGKQILAVCPDLPLDKFVDELFARHPKECIFLKGAKERILAALPANAKHEDVYPLADKEEIYCPYEGIDRRAEFGIAV